jgi:hypothetical protein
VRDFLELVVLQAARGKFNKHMRAYLLYNGSASSN